MTQSLEFDPQLATDATGYSVNRFYKAYTQENELILRPPFQRNMVWDKEQQSFLIDSILRGLPVPELYIQVKTAADGDEELVVVDGQQRISACIDFLRGELRLGASEDLDPRWRGKAFVEIDDELKARFRGFQLIVRRLPSTADTSVLREIFRRLNKTVEVLEAQELRHAAYTGPFIQLIEVASTHPGLQELGVFTPKDYLRRRNDEFLAEVFMAIALKVIPNKKEGLDELFLTYERQGVPADVLSDVRRRFGRIAAFISRHALALKKSRFRNKSDCYSLLVYLSNHAEHLPLEESVEKTVVDTLLDFSQLVNEIKRVEGSGSSIDNLSASPMGKDAVSYLRAVERAASDRANRVRRADALGKVLDRSVLAAPARPFAQADDEWVENSEKALVDEAINPEQAAQDREQVESTLIGGELE